MSDNFTPLVPPALSAEEPAFAPFALKLMTGGAESKPIEMAKSSARDLPSPPDRAPVITLQRAGDIISRIRVQCSCGQSVELQCIYPESNSK